MHPIAASNGESFDSTYIYSWPWSNANGYNVALLESFIQVVGDWSDFVALFVKDANELDRFQDRTFELRNDVENVRAYGEEEPLRVVKHSQAMGAMRGASSKKRPAAFIPQILVLRSILARFMRLGAGASSSLRRDGIVRTLARILSR